MRCAFWLLAMVAMGGSAVAAARDVEDYTYEAVCKVTNSYLNDLSEHIDRKEWGDIRKRAGRTREAGFYRYKNRDFAVEYDMHANGTLMVERVHFERARVPSELQAQSDFMKQFGVGAADKASVMRLWCDAHVLEARFNNGRMTDFIISLTAGSV